MSKPPSPDLTDVDVGRLRLAIVRMARRQRQQAGTGLTPTLQSALAVIDVQGPLTLGELAAVERVEPPTITRIVAKLEQLALVSRTADPNDGRVSRVESTAEGHHQFVESRERRDLWMRELLEHLDTDDVAALTAAIEPLERLLEVAKRPDGER